MKEEDVHVEKVKLYVQPEATDLDDPWDTEIAFVTTMYEVPIFGKLQVNCDKTDFAEEGRYLNPEALRSLFKRLPPDGCWIEVTGTIRGLSELDDDVFATMKGTDAKLVWNFVLDASEVNFIKAR